jgi:hypothetical protein
MVMSFMLKFQPSMVLLWEKVALPFSSFDCEMTY